MPTCAVKECSNKSNTSSLQKDGVTFHLFPKSLPLQDMWTRLCKRKPDWVPTRTSTVCSVHFELSQFQDLPNKRRKLLDNAIPTLHLPGTVNEIMETIKLIETSKCQFCINAPHTERKMKNQIQTQVKKIKREHAQSRYYKRKLDPLEKKAAILEKILTKILKSSNLSLVDEEKKQILKDIEESQKGQKKTLEDIEDIDGTDEESINDEQNQILHVIEDSDEESLIDNEQETLEDIEDTDEEL